MPGGVAFPEGQPAGCSGSDAELSDGDVPSPLLHVSFDVWVGDRRGRSLAGHHHLACSGQPPAHDRSGHLRTRRVPAADRPRDRRSRSLRTSGGHRRSCSRVPVRRGGWVRGRHHHQLQRRPRRAEGPGGTRVPARRARPARLPGAAGERIDVPGRHHPGAQQRDHARSNGDGHGGRRPLQQLAGLRQLQPVRRHDQRWRQDRGAERIERLARCLPLACGRPGEGGEHLRHLCRWGQTPARSRAASARGRRAS